MKKTLVVDTSVFIFDPKCLESQQFENCNIILPIQVLEELDKLKKFQGEVGKNARQSIRYLDEISSGGDIHVKIELPNKSTLKVECNNDSAIGQDASYNDNKILACAVNLTQNKKNKASIILVSRDINLRIRARSLGLIAHDYQKTQNKNNDEFYTGIAEIKDIELIQSFLENKIVNGSKLDLFPHQCVVFKDDEDHEVAHGRYVGNNIKPVKKHEAWGITPKNTEQMLAMDLMMDPSLPLVSISGMAGSGKSLISLACGLELVVNRNKYSKLIVMRPVETVGESIGYLPGSQAEKLAPYFAAIMDSFEVLLSSNGESAKYKKRNSWKEQLEYLLERDKINLEPMTFMRGRSISNALIIVDEAQNLRPEDAKTLLSRVSSGTKIIIEGDFSQIDAKNLDQSDNCLTTVIEAFKESKLAGHLTLKETHRSPLAAEAIKLL